MANEIFMAPPPGLHVPEGMVLCLIKAIYGTKQGGGMCGMMELAER
jgi:hypothetical protein